VSPFLSYHLIKHSHSRFSLSFFQTFFSLSPFSFVLRLSLSHLFLSSSFSVFFLPFFLCLSPALTFATPPIENFLYIYLSSSNVFPKFLLFLSLFLNRSSICYSFPRSYSSSSLSQQSLMILCPCPPLSFFIYSCLFSPCLSHVLNLFLQPFFYPCFRQVQPNSVLTSDIILGLMAMYMLNDEIFRAILNKLFRSTGVGDC
jgi:hypothetical protein